MGVTMPTKLKTQNVISSGGVVYQCQGDLISVVICLQQFDNTFNFRLPKGTPDQGESLQETALREVSEETGLDVVIEEAIDKIHYTFADPSNGTEFQKTVHFYLMRPTGGSFSNHDGEFDEVIWAEASEALRMLTYKEEVDILDKAIEMVSKKA